MFLCEEVDEFGACEAWREISWLVLEPSELGQIIGAILLVFAVAGGFRFLMHLLLNR